MTISRSTAPVPSECGSRKEQDHTGFLYWPFSPSYPLFPSLTSVGSRREGSRKEQTISRLFFYWPLGPSYPLFPQPDFCGIQELVHPQVQALLFLVEEGKSFPLESLFSFPVYT